ncbi:Hypothetical protein FKW44_018008 [Caligus rogercresseyi]|uniref:Uncharacterized protein n=1 Tax=Caligus rogercresseyi TaxID=217165 RepID=A0A7T8GUC6_CALRO|nr:Hypothetical protein FKW44_018008 [Caligus rogercresseyi]
MPGRLPRRSRPWSTRPLRSTASPKAKSESKRGSSQWLPKGSNPPLKFKRQ